MTEQKYILKGKEIVPVDLITWGKLSLPQGTITIYRKIF